MATWITWAHCSADPVKPLPMDAISSAAAIADSVGGGLSLTARLSPVAEVDDEGKEPEGDDHHHGHDDDHDTAFVIDESSPRERSESIHCETAS